MVGGREKGRGRGRERGEKTYVNDKDCSARDGRGAFVAARAAYFRVLIGDVYESTTSL